MKRIILSIIIIKFFTQNTYCQALTYFPFTSQLEVSSNPSKILWLQFRVQGNSVFTSMNTELAPMITFKRNPQSTFYLGPGVQFNLLNKLNEKDILNGYFLNIGSKMYPFEKNRKAGLTFEISPYSNKDFDLGTWRYLFGVSYNFNRK